MSGGHDDGPAAGPDLFAQARKALTHRSPFDADDPSAHRPPTLPAALASYLSPASESKKKHRKVLPDGATPAKVAPPPLKDGPRGIWAETAEYFRPVTVADVEFLESAAAPQLGGAVFDTVRRGGGEILAEQPLPQQVAQPVEVESEPMLEGGEEEREKKREVEGLEWLLGCKNKLLLVSEMPSKKRKLIGEAAGLVKLITVGEGQFEGRKCDVCWSRETCDGGNDMLQCRGCNMIVHKKCYGVTEVSDGDWLCSWCSGKDCYAVERACVLCSRAGGALKPVGGGDVASFAHLFCCLWAPEVYVENTKTMMPIVNIEGVKDKRKNLVCFLCKVKHGACIRCSRGTCRTPFHPICARDAKHRMEIWGKVGIDDVEFRAFCWKHSYSEASIKCRLRQNLVPISVMGDSSESHLLPIPVEANEKHELNLGLKNDDLCCSNLFSACVDSQIAGGEEKLSPLAATSGSKNCNGGLNTCDSQNIVLLMKKSLYQGKVSLHGLASDIGVSLNALVEALKGDDASFPSEWVPKLVKSMPTTPHLATLGKQSNRKKSDVFANATSEVTSGIGLLKDNNVVHTSSSEKLIQTNGGCGKVPCDIAGKPIAPIEDARLNNMNVDSSVEQCLRSFPGSKFTNSEGIAHFESSVGETDTSRPESTECNSKDEEVPKVLKFIGRNTSIKYDQTSSGSQMNPFIFRRLLQADNCPYKEQNPRSADCDGKGVAVPSHSGSSVKENSVKCPTISELDDHLSEAKSMEVLDYCPEDEVEGEIIYLQNKLIDIMMINKHHSENLIFNVVTTLQRELDYSRKQHWDTVVLNQFLSRVREAKKLGRKEKRHKEAQAVLAAATAAVAASSRMSCQRKDGHDDVASAAEENLVKVNVGHGRIPSRSQLVPRAKDTFTRSNSAAISKERSCDICRRGESILSPILVCGNCKVAVHLGCYHTLKDTTGPWYCEPCEEMIMQSQHIRSESISAHEWTCELCGWTSGAFRKSVDGRWVHAFCAEWILPTFQRGQSYPVEGLDSVERDRDTCCICQRRVGVCVKCSYGHCITTFHPICGKRASFYMKVRTDRGNFIHTAICEKHSLEQKEKEENQQYGAEMLGRLKQIRVELEKLRLLCERIVRREKVKKELLICSHDVLASKRNYAAFSIFVCSSLPHPDVSSESVTTSLKAHPEDNKSCSEGIQRSDDITVESTVSSELFVPHPQKTEMGGRILDSPMPQRQYTRKSVRISTSGKQPLHGFTSVPLKNTGEEEDKKSKARKNLDTLQKEMIMTSDQASIQNQRLPKGFAYVPIGCLSKEKQESDG